MRGCFSLNDLERMYPQQSILIVMRFQWLKVLILYRMCIPYRAASIADAPIRDDLLFR